MGLGHLPNKPNKPDEYTIHRRIDIRFVPANSFGSSLMYFTGSKTFNTTIRTACLKKGYTLCEYGLFKIEKDENGKFIKKADVYVKGEQIETKTEEDVFRFLGLEYKTPAQRDI
jgi:DNA polymerase/3'-5' exonuclease PolX